MAVRERSYRPYAGPTTRDRWRLLVIPKYAYAEVSKSRRFLASFVLSFVWPAVCVVLIYLHHNLQAVALLGIQPRDLVPIDGSFFRVFYLVQGGMGFNLAFLIGPGLISTDLAHNALPLYLARPFSRAEYVLGKLAVLAIVLSAISWIPALSLFAFQAALEGAPWAIPYWWIAPAVVVAGWVGIVLISLVTLALSAWLRWRPLARGVLVGLFVLGGVLSQAVRGLFQTDWGMLLSPLRMVVTIWDGLFRHPLSADVPLWSAWAVVGVMGLVSLLLLERKVSAYEVVE